MCTKSKERWKPFQWRLWTIIYPTGSMQTSKCFSAIHSGAKRKWVAQSHPEKLLCLRRTKIWISPLLIFHLDHYNIQYTVSKQAQTIHVLYSLFHSKISYHLQFFLISMKLCKCNLCGCMCLEVSFNSWWLPGKAKQFSLEMVFSCLFSAEDH